MSSSRAEPLLLSPRELLTSLFNSLPQTPATQEPCLPNNSKATIASNPLKALGATDRSLLVTLHVLFPSIFLQALDLLDRGLVIRIFQDVPSSSLPTNRQPQERHSAVPKILVEDSLKESLSDPNTIYLVRSAQSAHLISRRESSSSNRFGNAHGQGLSYIVRLRAWNCSCAAFAFSAFPGAASAPFSPVFENDNLESTVPSPAELEAGLEDGAQRAWQFGALSIDGTRDPQSVSCCKHLMACLLVERWKGILGTFVNEMSVGQREMAGLGVEGMI